MFKSGKTDAHKLLPEMNIPVQEYQKLTEDAKEKQECFDKLLRLHADFENFKKRSAKERQDFLKFANEGLMYELITILDNFERAFASATAQTDFKCLHQGVEMILKQMHQLLEKNGVKKIECVGKLFDPARQEAISHIETDEYPENTVVEEMQKGYILGERLIRPAVVKVAQKTKKD
ncbi:MAG: nucleotide exchange factor GrpE [Candidatus Omnitrophota bacterium]